MNLTELTTMTRLYTRDTDSRLFADSDIKLFINQAINRCRQYPIFNSMVALSGLTDSPILLPSEYHYVLALYASSRLFDIDERFYEGTEKRNEFEYAFAELVSNIESGNLEIKDATGTVVENTANAIDYIVDEYFDSTTDEEEVL